MNRNILITTAFTSYLVMNLFLLLGHIVDPHSVTLSGIALVNTVVSGLSLTLSVVLYLVTFDKSGGPK